MPENEEPNNDDDLTPDAPEASVPSGDDRLDPRLRPPDPAGTRPRVEPESLLPSTQESLLRAPADAEAEGVEIPLEDDDDVDAGDGDLLPSRRPSGAPALASASAPSPHAGRFGFALGALVAIAAAGLVVAVVVIGNRNDVHIQPRSTWSTWEPVKGAGDGPTQIARHVGPQYRLPTGRQLVLVTGGPLKVEGVNLDVAEVSTNSKEDIKVIKGDKTVMFRMCGLSTACTIPGTPSVNRMFLVHREALELALYTFQYTDANGVVVVFPPTFQATGKDGKLTADDLKKPKRVAAYFRRKQLSPRLDRPLKATLSPTTPSVATATTSPDALTVKDTTGSSVYDFSLTSGNTENKGYLVLQKG